MEKVKTKQKRKTTKPDYHLKVFKRTNSEETFYQVMVKDYPIILKETEVNTLLEKLKEINTTAYFVMTAVKEVDMK